MAAAERRHAGQAPDVDDRATALPDHAAADLLAEGKPTDHQVFEHLPHRVDLNVERISHHRLAGDIGKEVDPAEFRVEPAAEAGHRIDAGGVVHAGDGPSSGRHDPVAGLLHAAGIAVEHHDRGAMRRQRDRAGPAHAAGSSRHDSHAATQIEQSLRPELTHELIFLY